jgi:hypothetical protein
VKGFYLCCGDDGFFNEALYKSTTTYSFLAAATHIKYGTDCLTNALYADTQATVKNTIFTVAQMKEVDSEKVLYILLERTD